MDLGNRRFWLVALLGAIALLGIVLVSRGGATKAVKDVDAASRVMTGQQAIQEGEALKAQFRETSREWFQRVEEAQPR